MQYTNRHPYTSPNTIEINSLKSLRDWVILEGLKAGLWYAVKKSPYSNSRYIHFAYKFINKRNEEDFKRIAIVKVSDHYGGSGRNDKFYCINPDKNNPFCKEKLPQRDGELTEWLIKRLKTKNKGG